MNRRELPARLGWKVNYSKKWNSAILVWATCLPLVGSELFQFNPTNRRFFGRIWGSGRFDQNG